MKVKVKSIQLEGAEREFTFSGGLNLINGPISTGKTTLLECIRAILGSSLNKLYSEPRRTVTNLKAKLSLGGSDYTVIRPYKTTDSATVTIAGEDVAERLPAERGGPSDSLDYREWLMNQLNLPRLRAAKAPNKIDTYTSPVTINDYMMYAYLSEDEVSRNVIGSYPHWKENKRRVVFKVAYGIYSQKTAEIEEEIRELKRNLRSLKDRESTINEILKDTIFENRAKIVDELEKEKDNLDKLKEESISEAEQVSEKYKTSKLRNELREIEEKVSNKKEDIRNHKQSIEKKKELVSQLEKQVHQLTKSMVADDLLVDFDFVVCPRCGSDIEQQNVGEEKCYLCKNKYEKKEGIEDVEREIERVESQISETKELIKFDKERVAKERDILKKLKERREETKNEINYRTKSYVSEDAEEIEGRAESIAKSESKIEKLKEYLSLIENLKDTESQISKYEDEIQTKEDELEKTRGEPEEVHPRRNFFENKFRSLLDELSAPDFRSTGDTYIDRETLMPHYRGKNANDLSPGLTVLVNVAYIAAHQLTSLEFDLPLPNIIMADSISDPLGAESNEGDADLDPERIRHIYGLLHRLSNQFGIQVFVVDNQSPDNIEAGSSISFSEDDRLIPAHLLTE